MKFSNRELLVRVQSAVCTISPNDEVDDMQRAQIGHGEALRLLCKALGINDLLTREAMENVAIEDVDVQAVRQQVHRVLGAPGNYGYGTPLGEALRSLYNAPLGSGAQPTAQSS